MQKRERNTKGWPECEHCRRAVFMIIKQRWGVESWRCEDLVQDLCVRCCEGKVKDLWRPERGTWGTWLYLRVRGIMGSWYQTANRQAALYVGGLDFSRLAIAQGLDVWAVLASRSSHAAMQAAELRRRAAVRAAKEKA